MSDLPGFTPEDVIELAKLGVTGVQVEELGKAVSFINLQLIKPAARNAVRTVLDDVASLSDKLGRLIERMARPIDGAHKEAFEIIERGFWGVVQPGALDYFFVDDVRPRIVALSQAAKSGLESLPKAATRNRKADWYLVQVIEDFLVLGWLKMDMPDEEHESVMCLQQLHVNADEMQELLPDEFRRSASPDSSFRRIVGICHAAAGGNPDPERSLKAFMRHKKNRATLNP
jgi:hypothetical protein